jgi:hypothetical protein
LTGTATVEVLDDSTGLLDCFSDCLPKSRGATGLVVGLLERVFLSWFPWLEARGHRCVVTSLMKPVCDQSKEGACAAKCWAGPGWNRTDQRGCRACDDQREGA